MNKEELNELTVDGLRAYAKEHDINLKGRDVKADIVDTIFESVNNLAGDIAVDDQEADIDGEGDELSELGTDSDVQLEEGLADMAGGDVDLLGDPIVAAEGKSVEERIEWLEAVALERETVLSDIMGRASAAFERIEDLERAVKTLQKKLKTKGGDATLHGSVDDL